MAAVAASATGAARSTAEEHIAELLSAAAMPASTRIDGAASGARLLVTFQPSFDLFITRAVAYEVRIPMAYPATPPVVRCMDDGFIAEHGGDALLDGSGRPQLNILTIENMGWSKGYTLVDVVHCLRRTLVRKGPVVNVVAAPGERERRHSVAMSPTAGEYAPVSRLMRAPSDSLMSAVEAGSSRPASGADPRGPVRRASSAGLHDSGGTSSRSRPSSGRSAGLKSPRARPQPKGDLVKLQSGHFGLQGRRPTMEDNAVWYDFLPIKPSSTTASRPASAFHAEGDMTDPVSVHASGGYTPTAVGFFGVFDGHGGTAASDFAASRLHELVVARLSRGASVSEALFHAFLQIDSEFERMLMRPQSALPSPESSVSDVQASPFSSPLLTPMLGPAVPAASGGIASTSSTFGNLGDFDNPDALFDQSGCTAVTAVFAGAQGAGGVLTVAAAGDSRAVLCRKGVAVDMSVDHKTKRHDERARILAAGGIVFRGRVLGRLAVTRAIGDLPLKRGANDKPLVTAEPEIHETSVTADDEFLLLACDGVYDVMESQAAVDVVRASLASGMTPEAAAKYLADRAYALGSQDNISAIVVKIGRGPPKEAAQLLATAAAPVAVITMEPIIKEPAPGDGKPAAGALWPAAAAATSGAATAPAAAAPAPASSATKKKDRGPNPFAKSTQRAKAPSAAGGVASPTPAASDVPASSAASADAAAAAAIASAPLQTDAGVTGASSLSDDRPVGAVDDGSGARGAAGSRRHDAPASGVRAGSYDSLDAALGALSDDVPAPRARASHGEHATSSRARDETPALAPTWSGPVSSDDRALGAMLSSHAGKAASRYADAGHARSTAVGDASTPPALVEEYTAAPRRMHRSQMANAGVAALSTAGGNAAAAAAAAAAVSDAQPSGSGPSVRRTTSRHTMDTAALAATRTGSNSTPPGSSSSPSEAASTGSAPKRTESFHRPKGRRGGAPSESSDMDALGRALAGISLGPSLPSAPPLHVRSDTSESSSSGALPSHRSSELNSGKSDNDAWPAAAGKKTSKRRIDTEDAGSVDTDGKATSGYAPSFGGGAAATRADATAPASGDASTRSPVFGRRSSLDSATTLSSAGARSRAPSPAQDAQADVVMMPIIGGSSDRVGMGRSPAAGRLTGAAGDLFSGATTSLVPPRPAAPAAVGALAFTAPPSSVSRTLGTMVSAISAGGSGLYAAYGLQHSVMKSSQMKVPLAGSASAPTTPATTAGHIDFILPRAQYAAAPAFAEVVGGSSEGKHASPRVLTGTGSSSGEGVNEDVTPTSSSGLPPRSRDVAGVTPTKGSLTAPKTSDTLRSRSDAPAPRAGLTGSEGHASGAPLHRTAPVFSGMPAAPPGMEVSSAVSGRRGSGRMGYTKDGSPSGHALAVQISSTPPSPSASGVTPDAGGHAYHGDRSPRGLPRTGSDSGPESSSDIPGSSGSTAAVRRSRSRDVASEGSSPAASSILPLPGASPSSGPHTRT